MAISVQQLFRAIQASDFEAAKRAFNLNPSLVHAKHPRDSHTPLHAAAALGNLQLLRDLLHQGASCQALDCNNETPLHVASRQVGPVISSSSDVEGKQIKARRFSSRLL
jgi:ankyrin repeat protein